MGIALVLLSIAAPARADITAFIGANTTPANRQVRGGAARLGLLIVGFEVEYAFTPDDPRGGGAVAQDRHRQRRCCRRRSPIFGFQPYFTTGGGLLPRDARRRTATRASR